MINLKLGFMSGDIMEFLLKYIIKIIENKMKLKRIKVFIYSCYNFKLNND